MSLSLSLTFEGSTVRMVGTPEAPAWVASDVCAVLGIVNSRSTMAAVVPAEEKGVHNVYTPGGFQSMAVVAEAGLYRLIARSNKPEAKAFQRFVFGEVLPSIRKYGCYPPPHLNRPSPLSS